MKREKFRQQCRGEEGFVNRGFEMVPFDCLWRPAVNRLQQVAALVTGPILAPRRQAVNSKLSQQQTPSEYSVLSRMKQSWSPAVKYKGNISLFFDFACLSHEAQTTCD